MTWYSSKNYVSPSVVTILNSVMREGELTHPCDDGFERSVKFHVWRMLRHGILFLWHGRTDDLYHAFTRGMMAVNKLNGWK